MSEADNRPQGSKPSLKSYDDILIPSSESALYEALLHCRTAEEIRAFLTDLCTPQELDAMAERWVLARLLDRGGLSYRDISAATGASTTTVGRVARFLQQEQHLGYRRVLDRIKGGGSDTATTASNSAGNLAEKGTPEGGV